MWNIHIGLIYRWSTSDIYTRSPVQTLAKELGIRVVPTFKILKDGKIVKEVTGAKIDALVQAIDAVLSGDE